MAPAESLALQPKVAKRGMESRIAFLDHPVDEHPTESNNQLFLMIFLAWNCLKQESSLGIFQLIRYRNMKPLPAIRPRQLSLQRRIRRIRRRGWLCEFGFGTKITNTWEDSLGFCSFGSILDSSIWIYLNVSERLIMNAERVQGDVWWTLINITMSHITCRVADLVVTGPLCSRHGQTSQGAERHPERKTTKRRKPAV